MYIPATFLLWVLLFSSNCNPVTCVQNSGSQPVSHELWTSVLQTSVSETGDVNYKALKTNQTKLNRYLNLLSQSLPDERTWTRQQQMAYWINAYNAFTVKLILDNYPVNSIKDLNPGVAVPLVNTVWDRKFITIAGKKFTLNDIEHAILRKQFTDARIHFAINCASKSCPPLRREAYEAASLEAQLEEQARIFVNSPRYNRISAGRAELSPIFSWFSGDFKTQGSLIDFLNKYADIKIKPDAKITYLGYDWSLNDKP